jgi:hypothetical protein
MAEKRSKAAVKRHKWDPKTKAMIVVGGLKGNKVADICL